MSYDKRHRTRQLKGLRAVVPSPIKSIKLLAARLLLLASNLLHRRRWATLCNACAQPPSTRRREPGQWPPLGLQGAQAPLWHHHRGARVRRRPAERQRRGRVQRRHGGGGQRRGNCGAPGRGAGAADPGRCGVAGQHTGPQLDGAAAAAADAAAATDLLRHQQPGERARRWAMHG
jgi:hypothetical protein